MLQQREQELLARIAGLEAKLEAALAENEKLRRREHELQGRIEALEAELRRIRAQANPFARDRAGRSQKSHSPRRPGRKSGEGRFAHREQPEVVERTVRVPLPHCPDCGGELVDRLTHENFQQDLEVRVVNTRFVTESGYCGHCHQHHRSRHPEQPSQAGGAAGVTLGPRTLAWASDLKHHLGVSYGKISDFLVSHCGLKVTRSGLLQAVRRLAGKAEPVYSGLVEAVRAAPAVNVDETGWRVGSQSSWLWVFASKLHTVYAIDPRRSHEVVTKILGQAFAGILSCDCFSAYDHRDLRGWRQQKCLAHLQRELSELQANKRGRAREFPRKVSALLHGALKLDALQAEVSRAFYRQACQEIEDGLDALIDPQRRFADPDNARIANRLRKQRAHLFRFLYHDEVDPTNNRAERSLRPAVITRKTCRCNKNWGGAKVHTILASVFVTCRQQQRDLAQYIASLLQGNPPPLAAAATAHPP